mgnify:CR=1 FL=1
MGSPFKMGGHTLPGPNQKKSPMKLAITTALIGAGVAAATTAANAKMAADRQKAARKAQLQKDAAEASRAGTEGMAKDMTSTKIID